jgi:hypothetical protein
MAGETLLSWLAGVEIKKEQKIGSGHLLPPSRGLLSGEESPKEVVFTSTFAPAMRCVTDRIYSHKVSSVAREVYMRRAAARISIQECAVLQLHCILVPIGFVYLHLPCILCQCHPWL